MLRLRFGITFAITLCIATHGRAQDPATRAREAGALVAAGKSADAIRIYRELLKQFPANAVLFMNLSIAEFNAARFQDTIEDANHALTIDGNLRPARLFLGAGYVKSGQYEAALEPLRTVTAADPGDMNAQLMLGQATLETRHFDEALQSFRAVTGAQPANAPAWYGLGRTCNALAGSAAGELEKRFPGSSFALTATGDRNLDQQRLGSAYEAYRKSLAAGTVLEGACSGLAHIYKEIGHADWMRAECLSRTNPDLPSSTGSALYETYRGFRDEARKAFERLLALPPSLEQFLYTAKERDDRGDFVSAAIEWRKALALTPESPEVRTGLAWSLYRSRDYRSALSIVKDLLRTGAKSVTPDFLYGAILLNLQEPDQAIPYLTAALKIDPQFSPAHAAIGQALLQQGKARTAIPHLIAGLSTDEDGTVRYQLLRAYQITGQMDLAKNAALDYQSFRSSAEKRKINDAGAEITKP
jgi:tetratricopeptide (TPR) repeat protein